MKILCSKFQVPSKTRMTIRWLHITRGLKGHCMLLDYLVIRLLKINLMASGWILFGSQTFNIFYLKYIKLQNHKKFSIRTHCRRVVYSNEGALPKCWKPNLCSVLVHVRMYLCMLIRICKDDSTLQLEYIFVDKEKKKARMTRIFEE